MKMYNISASSHYSENVEEKFKNKFSTFFPQKSYRLQDKIEGNMSRARKAVGIMQPHTHTHTHTNTHTHICNFNALLLRQTYINNTYMHTTCIHTYMHTCMHACMHTYIHTCMHTYIHSHNIH